MYSNDLNNSYSYECERRKDELREAARSEMLRDLRHDRKSSPRLVVALNGLALVLTVLSLLLMGCSPQAAQMEPEANSVPKAASYQAVLGKSLNDRVVDEFMLLNNCSSSNQFQLCQDKGMALWSDSNQIIKTVYLYSGIADGFRRYQGALPYKLSFYDPMWKVQDKLKDQDEDEELQPNQKAGLPDEADSPDRIHYWAVYRQLGITVIYDSPGADPDAYIYAILVNY